MLTWLARAHDRLSDAGLGLGVAALAAIATLSFAATMSRYLLGTPIGWVPDWTGYLLAFSIFATAPAVTRCGMHVSMDLLAAMVRASVWQRALGLLASLLTLAILTAISIIVAQSTLAAWRAGTSTAAAYPIPRWWLMAAVFYGFAFSAIHVLRSIGVFFPGFARAPSPVAVSVNPPAKD